MDKKDFESLLKKYPDCVSDGKKLKAFLKDLFPDVPKAILNTLMIMANDGVIFQIQSSEVSILDLTRLKKNLEDDYGISRKYIDIAFELCAATRVDLSDSDVRSIPNDDSRSILSKQLKIIHNAALKAKQDPKYQRMSENVIEYMLIVNTAKAALFGWEGRTQSYETAFVLFDYLFKVYSQPDIAYYLGYMYEKGYYVEQDYNMAYLYYMISAIDSNKDENLQFGQEHESAKAKIQLGMMIVNHRNMINVEGIDDSYYWWAMGLYLCASDDGLQGAYDLLKFLGLANESEGLTESFMNPIPVFDKAKAGDTAAMLELANIYLSPSYMPQFAFKYSMKWAKKGYECGDEECMKLYISLLIENDHFEYNCNPDDYEVVYQEGDIYELSASTFGDGNEYNLCDEVLVVHSKDNILKALDLLVEYCSKYPFAWFIGQYVNLINTANSFMRPKKGLPGYEE